MTTFRRIGISWACLSLAACGATGAEQQFEQQETSNVAPAEQLLTHFSFEDLELSFYEIRARGVDSAEAEIGVEESFRSVDYLGALRKEYGSVTALEIFNAFAPADLEPPTALLARHEAQARALGRTGADLEARIIDASTLPVDKAIPSDCASQLFPDITPGSYIWSSLESFDIGADGLYFYLCVSIGGSDERRGGPIALTTPLGCVKQDNRDERVVGICNDTASANSTEFWTQINGPLGSITTTQRTSVAPGSVGRFSMLPATDVFGFFNGLGVIGRNSTANAANFHRLRSGIGRY